MSLFDRILGNAGKVDNQQAKNLVAELLITNETIQVTYRLIRDLIIFTNKRLILIDIQGSGKKKEFLSIPYSSISRFSIETAGTLDMDSEIDLYLSNASEPVISLQFGRKNEFLYEIARIIAEETLN